MLKPSRFTLIELLVVMGILVILISTMLPVLGMAKERGRRVSCAGNLKQIGLGLRVYANDSEERFPEGDNAAGLDRLLISRDIKSLKVFTCPSTDTPRSPEARLHDANLDYIYRGGMTERSCGEGTGVACDRIQTPNHERYGNVLMGDGHVFGVASIAANMPEESVVVSGVDDGTSEDGSGSSYPEWASRNNFHNTGGWPNDPH